MRFASPFKSLTLGCVLSATALVQAGLPVPAYSSRPGAAYTVYLDFGGFAYNGTWLGETPGTIPAYNSEGSAGSFTANELSNIQKIWARTAEKYTAFNVNVTTVDPAASGLSDAQRQLYYDKTPQTMHTIIGGTSAWAGGNYGGYSFVGTTAGSYDPAVFPNYNGAHTNFSFPNSASSNLKFLGEVTAHENGHGFGLQHQSDVTTNPVTGYSPGDVAGPTNGYGSVAPIMGNSYSTTRGLWRTGTEDDRSIQNDVQTMLNNPNMRTLLDDGVGHSLATATALAVSGGLVDSLAAQGFIAPVSSTNPNAIGIDSYTKDYFAFATDGTAISLTLNAGAQRIAAGIADDGATFDGFLNIRDGNGNLLYTGSRAANTLSSTFSGVLPAGSYFAEITSFGGYTSLRESTAQYFTMGSYFLTGRGGFQAVPEPTTLVALGLGAAAFLRRRRKA